MSKKKTRGRDVVGARCPAPDNYIRHCTIIHDATATIFKRIVVRPPPIEKVTEWKPPFEAVLRKPTFRIVPGPSTITETPKKDINTILHEMITLPAPLSPINDPQPADEQLDLDTPDESSSYTSVGTICLDERQPGPPCDIFIYSIYGLLE